MQNPQKTELLDLFQEPKSFYEPTQNRVIDDQVTFDLSKTLNLRNHQKKDQAKQNDKKKLKEILAFANQHQFKVSKLIDEIMKQERISIQTKILEFIDFRDFCDLYSQRLASIFYSELIRGLQCRLNLKTATNKKTVNANEKQKQIKSERRDFNGKSTYYSPQTKQKVNYLKLQRATEYQIAKLKAQNELEVARFKADCELQIAKAKALNDLQIARVSRNDPFSRQNDESQLHYSQLFMRQVYSPERGTLILILFILLSVMCFCLGSYFTGLIVIVQAVVFVMFGIFCFVSSGRRWSVTRQKKQVFKSARQAQIKKIK